jgi:hypothetical protein
MRLLEYSESGKLSIHSFDDGATPPYAILSHTWGADGDEVTFADLGTGVGKNKPGYEKILFCERQARHDGLEYFWIDTCCIDTTDKAEHSRAIQSMFRWYQSAAKCYVYLSDVSSTKRGASNTPTESNWEPAFRSSRWFKRGWTLQELLAPIIVEFFSEEGKELGDKISLQLLIYKITNIPPEVLNGSPISQFSVNERLRWAEGRITKHEEDRAYSLQGIFDVELVPMYGEGEAGAFDRLKREIHRLERCFQDMHNTNPRDDKRRIEESKGGLLFESYRWVLDNNAFQQWRQDSQGHLLWVKGDPGKGKTMLLCGIIDELHNSTPKTTLLSYFFCQATDSRINSATAVLRGLLYMLVHQQPSLVSHIRKKHDYAGRSLFEDANAWVALTEIFADVLRDPSLSKTYLIIDALDECVTDRPKLLEFVAKQSSTSDRVKWIVSSRNWPNIEAQLERAGHKVRLSLELNAKSVAAAVGIFIRQKVDQLAQDKQYKAEIRDAVVQHLTSNANDTFLWVALVCQDLKTTPKFNVLRKLALFPPGLDALYKRMLDQISESDIAEICQQVLASTAVLYRPVTIPELVALVQPLEYLANDPESVRMIVSLCGSFLTLQDNTVYFVHQSAKDFLFTKVLDRVFPYGTEAVHQAMFSKSLAILSRTLRRDMYSLEAPGFHIVNVETPDLDPLLLSRYPCIYWIDHLHDSKPTCLVNSVANFQMIAVNNFLRKKCLYWLEGLSLCKNLGQGVVSITKLWRLLQVWYSETACPYRVNDADASRRCRTKISSLSLFKMRGDSLCITNMSSRVIHFKHMHLRCCSVRLVV